MPHGARWFLFIFCISITTGCATNDLMIKRQAESDAKVEHLIQVTKKGEQRMNELAAQMQSDGEKSERLQQQIKQYQDVIKELRSAQDELKARVLLLAQQAATPKVEVVNPEPVVKNARDAGPPADYVKAFGLYSANNFDGAISAFDAFVKNNPKSDFVANAIYWIGECHYSLSDLPKARESFMKVSGTYPNSQKAPDALLKLGYTLSAMNEKEKANAIFDTLIKTYPSSGSAQKARERLSSKQNP